MRDNLPFDDFVKKQFTNYSPDVPGHIWQNIIAAKRTTKPKGFWMTFFSGSNLLVLTFALLMVGGGLYYFQSSGNSNSSDNSHSFSPAVNTSTEKNKGNNSTDINPPGNENTTQAQTENTVEPSADMQLQPGNTTNQNHLFTKSNSREHRISNINDVLVNNNSNEINKNGLAAVPSKTEVTNTLIFSPFNLNNARELGTKTLNAQNIKLPDCPSIEKNAAANKQYWEVYVGPDKAFESYKSYGDTASANYLQKRKASTKLVSAFSAGARYTKVFNNGTSVRAGVNYTQINEKFEYFNPNEIKYVTVITTRVVIRSPGDTLYINDTLQYQQSGSRTRATYNRYRNIDIPVVIGYELGNGKIHANINAGVIINVYSWYKGDVLDTLYQPVSITTGKGNSTYQFKNNIGVGFLGSVSVYYKMTDKLHILVEPYFRYNLSPMSKENLNLQQKYHVAGLRAGIRFDLK